MRCRRVVFGAFQSRMVPVESVRIWAVRISLYGMRPQRMPSGSAIQNVTVRTMRWTLA